MRTPKKTSRTRRAQAGILDLSFALLIVLSTILPAISLSYRAGILQSAQAANAQKLSAMLQASELYYADLAAQKSSPPFSAESYSRPGILGAGFAQGLPARADYASMGLEDFRILHSPPEILSSSQYCIRRVFLDSQNAAQRIWFCAE